MPADRLSTIAVAIAVALAIAATIVHSSPVFAADLCLQLDGGGCALSGDTGFFRFSPGKFPSNAKKPVRLNGRVCAYGTAWGTAAMSSDASTINLSASFVCDATYGAITADFNPATTSVGSTASIARASYGDVSLSTSCTATVVDCANEP